LREKPILLSQISRSSMLSKIKICLQIKDILKILLTLEISAYFLYISLEENFGGTRV
jgi:hypothetical protein